MTFGLDKAGSPTGILKEVRKFMDALEKALQGAPENEVMVTVAFDVTLWAPLDSKLARKVKSKPKGVVQTCRECGGSGEVQSHNPKCPECNGIGYRVNGVVWRCPSGRSQIEIVAARARWDQDGTLAPDDTNP